VLLLFRFICPLKQAKQGRKEASKQSDWCLFGLFFDPEVETVRFFYTSLNFYQTTRRHNAEDSTRHSHLPENFIFYAELLFDLSTNAL
jgi:hypothetical protein